MESGRRRWHTTSVAVGVLCLLLLAAGCGGTPDEPRAVELPPLNDEARAAAQAVDRRFLDDDGFYTNEQYEYRNLDVPVALAMTLEETGGADGFVARTADLAERTLAEDVGPGLEVLWEEALATVFLLRQGRDVDTQVEALAASVDDDGRVVRGPRVSDKVEVQTWVSAALLEAEHPRGRDAVEALLTLRCADGSLPGKLVRRAADTCVERPEPGGDAAATALLVVALAPVADRVEGLPEALDEAVAWLLEAQGPDGAYVGGFGEGDAGITSLAARALGTWGEPEAAAEAATWAAELQLPESGLRGLVAPTVEDREIGGWDELGESRWVVTTTDAVGALIWLD